MTAKPSKQQEILKVAYHLFRSQGYHATGLNQILELSNCGKSQLYHYYSNKENLLLASLDFYANKIYQETAKFMLEINSLEDFEMLIRGCERLCKSQNRIVGCFVGSISAECSPSNENIRLHCFEIYENWKNLFMSGLHGLQEKSLLSKDANKDELAEYFLSSVQGAFLMAKTLKDIKAIQRTLSRSINYIRSYAI